MAHQRYEQTSSEYWKHDEKWNKYCEVCSAKKKYPLKFLHKMLD